MWVTRNTERFTGDGLRMAGGGLRVVIDRSLPLHSGHTNSAASLLRSATFRSDSPTHCGWWRSAICNRQSAIGGYRLAVDGWRLKSEVGQSSVSTKKVYNSECYDPLARVKL